METDKSWLAFQLSTRRGLAQPRISLVSLTLTWTEVAVPTLTTAMVTTTTTIMVITTIWIRHTIMIIDKIMRGPTQLLTKAPRVLIIWWTMIRTVLRVPDWAAYAIYHHLHEKSLQTITLVDHLATIITTRVEIQERLNRRTRPREEHLWIIQMTIIQGKCLVLKKLLVAASDLVIIRTGTSPWTSRTTTCQCTKLACQTRDRWFKEYLQLTMLQTAAWTQLQATKTIWTWLTCTGRPIPTSCLR